MSIKKAFGQIPQRAETAYRKRYQKPELVRWGSLRELTRGPIEGLNSDEDFTGSQGV